MRNDFDIRPRNVVSKVSQPEPTEVQKLEMEYNALIQAHNLLAKLSRLPTDLNSTLNLRSKITKLLNGGDETPDIKAKVDYALNLVDGLIRSSKEAQELELDRFDIHSVSDVILIDELIVRTRYAKLDGLKVPWYLDAVLSNLRKSFDDQFNLPKGT